MNLGLSLLKKKPQAIKDALVVQKGRVSLHDFGTMATKPYAKISESMNTIDNYVKGTKHSVDFFDANVAEHDKTISQGTGSNNILVKVTNIITGKEQTQKIIHDETSNEPFVRQAYQAVSEMITGKKSKPIDTEIAATKAKHEAYINKTGISYKAQRGDVVITDPHSMVAGSFKQLRDNIDPISKYAKENNKAITFEDGRTQFADSEFPSISLENKYASKVRVIVKDKTTGETNDGFVDYFEDRKTPFMKKISNTVGELVTGKPGSNIDKELKLKSQ